MNNSRSINLITCMKFFKTLINNDTEFINKDKLKSLEGLKTARSNYCHLLWLKSIIEDMKSHVDEAIDKYNTNIEPLINNISQVTNEDNESLYYGMWNLNYQNYNDLPVETKHSWADMTEYNDALLHIKALNKEGYPDNNNIRPIKELKSSTSDDTENKFLLVHDNTEKKVFDYYKYEINKTNINLPIIENLDEIPPCFYYYEGDKYHQSGVYMSPYNGVVLQVPRVSVMPYSMENANYGSMKCKEKSNCKNIRCTYAHPGTDYIKVGCIPRCPHAHSFGDKDSITDDLKLINIEDVRIVSMYGLNDLFSATLWFANKINKPGHRVLTDLELCDNYTNEEFLNSDESNPDKFS